MSSAALISPSPPPAARLKSWRWTVAHYERAAAMGWFRDQRVELIEGKVVRMPPQLEPHVAAIHLGKPVLAGAFGDGYTIRSQAPIRLSNRSKPEPDLAVVPGDPDYYVIHGPPASALLIVEVSDSTLIADRVVKAELYAKHSIQDYWIVNLVDRQLEVHRRPILQRIAGRRRFRYADVTVLRPDASSLVSPLAVPNVQIKVASLFPIAVPPRP